MRISLTDLPPKAREQAIAKLAIEEARRRNKTAEIPGAAPEEPKKPKENKYHAQKTERVMPNGKTHVFDSKREAEHYDELAVLLKSGKIRNLKLQPQFTLIEGYITENGDVVKPEKYVADFSYERCETHAYQVDGGYSLEYVNEWVYVVEDVKGRRTQVYINKKKQMQDKFGITVLEV